MDMSEVVFTKRFMATLAGNPCPVDVEIQRSFAASISFLFDRKPVNFTCTTWCTPSGMQEFLGLFYGAPRDPSVYGSVSYDDEGQLTSQPSRAQKFEAIASACADVMANLDLVVSTYDGAMLDYAHWFHRSKALEPGYFWFIARLTCDNIVTNELHLQHPHKPWMAVVLAE